MKTTMSIAIDNAINAAFANVSYDVAARVMLMMHGIDPDVVIGNGHVFNEPWTWVPGTIIIDSVDEFGRETRAQIDLAEAKVCYKDLDTVGAEYGNWWDIPTETDEVGDLHYFIAEREAWIEEENDRIASATDDDEISWSRQLISNWEEEIERAYSSMENYDEFGNLVG